MVVSMSRSTLAARITVGRIPARLVHEEHARRAEEVCYRRIGGLTSSPEEMLTDWYSARYGTHKATRILEAVAGLSGKGSPATDVELSEAIALELQSSGAEECRAVLAWHHWYSDGAIVDSSLDRAQGDWAWACRTIKSALSCRPTVRRDSLRAWVERRYVTERARTIREKAHLHSLGPHRSGHEGDYAGAGAYVVNLAALATAAVSARATAGDHDALVRFLLQEDNLQWEDAFELLLPCVVAVDRIQLNATSSSGSIAWRSQAAAPGVSPLLGALPSELVEWEHRGFASLLCLRRASDRAPSHEEMLGDWYSAGYGMAKAVDILHEIERMRGTGLPAADVELSEAVAIELQSTGVEECKAMLAWLRWSKSGRAWDLDHARMLADWLAACGELRDALSGVRPIARDDSVRAWVEQRYVTDSARTIREKAYLHSLGPRRSGHEEDHAGAEAYVKNFAALARAAVSARATADDHDGLVRFLLKDDNWEWQDATEALLPRVAAIHRDEFRPVLVTSSP